MRTTHPLEICMKEVELLSSLHLLENVIHLTTMGVRDRRGSCPLKKIEKLGNVSRAKIRLNLRCELGKIFTAPSSPPQEMIAPVSPMATTPYEVNQKLGNQSQ